jgi:GT2 family glycosyltransferase
MLTVVIPTRNRPSDLLRAIQSVCVQTRVPSELLIIDQSLKNQFVEISTLIFSVSEKIKLNYIHDPTVPGLVAAKEMAVSRAIGDVICFLEDDVVLESNYLEQVESSFNIFPSMMGCCGVVTNPPQVVFFYVQLFKLFHQGIFKDKRVGLALNKPEKMTELIESDKLSGGISAWRREVFESVHFDTHNGFHMFEDIDFSTRVARHYGGQLYINPHLRLAHYCSPINRDFFGARQKRKLIECFVYYKKRRDWPYATISFTWVLVGMFLEAIFQSALSYSIDPIKGYVQGLKEGFGKKLITVAYE